MLKPVLDFERRTATELYLETIEPKYREAIENKEVIEGMDKEMVLLAKGRPTKKYRDFEDGLETEDWIYGDPPGELVFITFVDGDVTGIKTSVAEIGGWVKETAEIRALARQARAVAGALARSLDRSSSLPAPGRRVRGAYRVVDHLRMNLERFVVDRLALCNRPFRDSREHLSVGRLDADPGECDRQADPVGKGQHFLEQTRGLALQHQLHERAERDFFPVEVGGAFRERR